MNTNFDYLSAMTTLLTNNELEALALKCEDLIKNRQQIQREKLRQELMKNLQKAMDDILHNDFDLMIENVENPNWVVQFSPGEKIYHIEIK